jgi:hypothetical protein
MPPAALTVLKCNVHGLLKVRTQKNPVMFLLWGGHKFLSSAASFEVNLKDKMNNERPEETRTEDRDKEAKKKDTTRK